MLRGAALCSTDTTSCWNALSAAVLLLDDASSPDAVQVVEVVGRVGGGLIASEGYQRGVG